ncbi:hypothetical protein HPB50_012359 [Hyalomma asiaticum]|uniref:Uncharacterized protein n=1 Tax=Hyalomma asiaticum TaxID=266040 RepID=A0ACB7S2J3_HYAAI|nr:hypothetical protein HPB50_012359 [Hyalomma asiaticum]
MIEGTPGQPYGSLISHFNVVEANMKARRDEASAYLKQGERVLCVTTFPRLGCPGFTYPVYEPHPKDSNMRSLFFPDEATFPGHPRFRTLVRNIRERRGKKVVINVPIFKDKNTPSPFVEDYAKLGDDGEAARAALPDHVYMDSMGFGMGNCCLQVTFQACNISEARVLYDQLAPVCPIMLALSAASPVFRGYLTERDCRWNVIVSSVDDRTDEELGLKPLRENKFVIRKSRYSTIECYISELGEKYNDVKVVYDQDIYNKLRSADIDPLLAQHVAHLFIRDPISLFGEKVDQNDEEDTDHFENLQSTNWHSMRFKPPPPNSSIGWRVEFRPSELQMTEFENAAYVVFVVLLTRVILSYKLSFLIPISKVDQNMEAAQKRDAVRTQKFWFRSDILTCMSPPSLAPTLSPGGTEHHDYLSQMTINEIINGKPEYKQDSVVSERINYDLLLLMSKIQDGSVGCPELFGTSTSKTKAHIPSAILNATGLPSAPALVKDSVLRPECVGRSVAVGDSNAADLLGRVGSSACRNAICSDGRASEPSKTAPGATAVQTCSLTPRTPYILLRVKAPVELAERRAGIIGAEETGASLSASPTGARVASVGESAPRCRVSEERRRHTRASPRARSSCAKLARRLRHHHHPMFAPSGGGLVARPSAV